MTLWRDRCNNFISVECFCTCIDSYDQTDAITQSPAVTAHVEVDRNFIQTDNPEQSPSYADFLIAYPTQSCKLNFDE